MDSVESSALKQFHPPSGDGHAVPAPVPVPPAGEHAVRWTLAHRYGILCVGLFVLMGLRAFNGQWIGDFWEHSASLRALITNLRAPPNPFLPVNAPHPDFNPYLLFWALVSRLAGLDPLTALSVAALVNLSLLLAGLHWFVKALTRDHSAVTSFYALVLVLFAWGPDAWSWSSFLNIGALSYVLPYPSTFACAVSLITLALNRYRLDTQRSSWGLIAIGILFLIILLSHPLTFVFLAAGLIAFQPDSKKRILINLSLLGAIVLVAILLALAWPYFSLLDLCSHASAGYHKSGRSMYQGVFRRIWPLLLAIPWMVVEWRSSLMRTLGVMLALLGGVYAWGWIAGNGAFGRVLAQVTLLLAVAMADRLARLERWITQAAGQSLTRCLLVPCLTGSACLALSYGPLLNSLSGALPAHRISYAAYESVASHIGPQAIVLADLDEGWRIVTFSGKTVATHFYQGFIPDHAVRQAAVNTFFTVDTDPLRRQEILNRYAVDFVLISKRATPWWRTLVRTLASCGGTLVIEDQSLVLVSMHTTVSSMPHVQGSQKGMLGPPAGSVL